MDDRWMKEMMDEIRKIAEGMADQLENEGNG